MVARRALTTVAGTTRELPAEDTLVGGLPTGGTTGQVLTKSSSADYAAGWADAASGGGGSAAADGIGTLPTLWISGIRNAPAWAIGATSSSTISSNNLYFVPFQINRAGTPNRISFRVATAGQSGDLVRCGIYGLRANGLPGALIADAGTTAVNTTGFKDVTFTCPALPVGLYWVAFSTNAFSTSLTSINPSDGARAAYMGSDGQGRLVWVLASSVTFGPLPSDVSGQVGSFSTTSAPIFYLGVA